MKKRREKEKKRDRKREREERARERERERTREKEKQRGRLRESGGDQLFELMINLIFFGLFAVFNLTTIIYIGGWYG